jgi:hypothetical protein
MYDGVLGRFSTLFAWGSRWPARLPDQPIFYPVVNEEYAT